MKLRYILLIIVVIAFACNKDKITTKPHLKFKGTSPADSIKASDGVLNIELDFTDKQGDVNGADSLLRIMIFRQNIRKPPIPPIDTFYQRMPDFPNGTKEGTILAQLGYSSLNAIHIIGGVEYPDTVILKFVLKDKAGNLSDTATSGIIIAK